MRNPVEELRKELIKRRVLRKRTSRKRKAFDIKAFVKIVGYQASAYGTQGGFY
jgi:hypothetical protein